MALSLFRLFWEHAGSKTSQRKPPAPTFFQHVVKMEFAGPLHRIPGLGVPCGLVYRRPLATHNESCPLQSQGTRRGALRQHVLQRPSPCTHTHTCRREEPAEPEPRTNASADPIPNAWLLSCNWHRHLDLARSGIARTTHRRRTSGTRATLHVACATLRGGAPTSPDRNDHTCGRITHTNVSNTSSMG